MTNLLRSLLLISFSLFSLAVSAKEHLVSIDGALTEIVYALGAEKQLVAVDSTSLYPKAATELPNVGYIRALSTEGVLSVRPNKIITTSSAGPKPAIEQLKASGVEVVIIDTPNTLEGVKNKILSVGQAVNKQESANQLVATIDSQLKPVLENIATHKKQAPTTLFFLGMQGNQLMAAGQHTQADALMQLVGLKNAGGNFHSYKPLSKEAVLSINPEVIIISQHSKLDPSVKEAFAYTQAYKNNKILVARSHDLLGFGPRIAESLKLISDIAYK